MSVSILKDPLTGEPVEVRMPYSDWIWYAKWVRHLVEKGLPVPEPQEPIEIPSGLPDFGDPVQFQRRLRDGDD